MILKKAESLIATGITGDPHFPLGKDGCAMSESLRAIAGGESSVRWIGNSGVFIQ